MILLWSYPARAEGQQATSADAIINGLPAQAQAHPWMVAFVRNTSRTDLPLRRLQFCGGTLIHPQWVLTAAHCVIARSVTDMSLIIGASDLDAGGIELRTINQIVLHPKYNARTFENDIALVRLTTPSAVLPLQIDKDIPDAALSGLTAKVYGWGQTYIFDEKCKPIFSSNAVNPGNFSCRIYDLDPGSRDFQARLLQTSVTLLSHASCVARVKELLRFLAIPDSGDENSVVGSGSAQLCAYDPNEQTGVCFGDSGGPLIIEQDGKLLQVGIASLIFGSGGCARKLATEIYTKTAGYADFIDDVTHRDYALSFEYFCPPRLAPAVGYASVASGGSRARIYWEPYAQAAYYTVRYSSYPHPPKAISSFRLDSSVTEISAELAANTSFYVTIQAANEFCSGPDSSLLLVQVPAP